MTGQADFSTEEWETIAEGPSTAGMIVITSQRGGTFRETFSMAKAYTEARKQHGSGQLLDEIVSQKPKVDRTKSSNFEEMKEHGLSELRDAVALVDQKASPEEAKEYRDFILTVAHRVAEAHKEGGEQVSDSEQRSIDDIKAAISTDG